MVYFCQRHECEEISLHLSELWVDSPYLSLTLGLSQAPNISVSLYCPSSHCCPREIINSIFFFSQKCLELWKIHCKVILPFGIGIYLSFVSSGKDG